MFHKLIFILITFLAISAKSQVRDTIIKYNLKSALLQSENADSLYTFSWNESLKFWKRNEKFIYQFNSGNNLLSKVKSEWKDNSWLLYDKSTYEYFNNRIEREAYYWWDLSYQEWINSKQSLFEYDSLSNLIELQKQYWIENSLQWKNDSLFNYEYNSSNKLSNLYKKTWSDIFNDWERIRKISYVYDSHNNITSIIDYFWEFDMLIWEPYQKKTMIYNEDAKLVEMTNLIIESSSSWTNEWKQEYTYYENGLLKQEEYFIWYDNEYWLEDYRFVYQYDDENRLVNKIGDLFDWDLLLWEKHFKINIKYLDDNHLKRTTFYTWNSQSFDWKNLEKHEHYYPGYTNISIVEADKDIYIYPNPVDDRFFIVFNEPINEETSIILYDLCGKVVKKENANIPNSQYELFVDIVKPGVYLLHIKSNSLDESIRVFIKR